MIAYLTFRYDFIYPDTEVNSVFEFCRCVAILYYGNRKQLWVNLTERILHLRGLEKKKRTGKGSNINNAEC